MPTWRDDVSRCAEVGRGPDVRNVWARVGDFESHAAVVPTLLDSLGPDNEPSNPIPGDVGGPVDDECNSAQSESCCWSEMENIGDDVDWGLMTHPMSSADVVPAPHVLSDRVAVHAKPQGRCEVKRLRLIVRSPLRHPTPVDLPPSPVGMVVHVLNLGLVAPSSPHNGDVAHMTRNAVRTF